MALAAAIQVARDLLAELAIPVSDGLIGGVDTGFCEDFLHVAEAQ